MENKHLNNFQNTSTMPLFKTLLFCLLSLLSFSSLSQDDQIVAAGKSVGKSTIVKFLFVVNEKKEDPSEGSLLFIRETDLKNFDGLHAFLLSDLIKKDSSLENLPNIPNGSYAYWHKRKKKWIVKVGGLLDLQY